MNTKQLPTQTQAFRYGHELANLCKCEVAINVGE